jgi:LacI family transcriptional regulator
MRKREKRRPTVREVADLAGVGMITVSRVINNQPSVRPATRRRVLAPVAELGYQRNEAARILMGHPATMIGLIVPDLSDSFFASCAQTVQHVAASTGYMTMVAASERNTELEIEQAQGMAGRNLSGIILVTSTQDGDPRLRELQANRLPIVGLDRPIPGLQADAVVTEDLLGAETGVRHLIEHGHKRIACVGYDTRVYTSVERIEGYSRAMRYAGLVPKISPDLPTYEDVKSWVAKVMRSKEAPTAIFSLNPVNSCRLLQVSNEAGISIPGDVALVGFGDFELSSVVSPSLTTLSPSPVEMARRAMLLLFDRIKGTAEKTPSSTAKLVLPAKLVIRKSCGCNINLNGK